MKLFIPPGFVDFSKNFLKQIEIDSLEVVFKFRELYNKPGVTRRCRFEHIVVTYSMVDADLAYQKLIDLLDKNGVEYKLFSHKEALTWEELAEVQKETGFFGTEMKCMVLKAGEKLIVYITTQGKRVNFDAIKEKLGVNKVRLSTPEELNEYFGAKPGCAYPFGFDAQYDIYVDPEIYEQEWMLFSPVVPSKTVQAKGSDLKNVFSSLENKVYEVTNFNTL